MKQASERDFRYQVSTTGRYLDLHVSQTSCLSVKSINILFQSEILGFCPKVDENCTLWGCVLHGVSKPRRAHILYCFEVKCPVNKTLQSISHYLPLCLTHNLLYQTMFKIIILGLREQVSENRVLMKIFWLKMKCFIWC